MNIEDIIISLAGSEDFQEFLMWIFEKANLDDFSISGEIQKDYYLLGRQSLANEIRETLKRYAIDSYISIVQKVNDK